MCRRACRAQTTPLAEVPTQRQTVVHVARDRLSAVKRVEGQRPHEFGPCLAICAWACACRACQMHPHQSDRQGPISQQSSVARRPYRFGFSLCFLAVAVPFARADGQVPFLLSRRLCLAFLWVLSFFREKNVLHVKGKEPKKD
ncbi:hypothetical protein psal_cds_378 [Pandoravirus salinus]|uniref:Uncharacterized protein n=1 Tax=Pandoravirus salinus TaxID=1349410 RepID=S4W1Q0_9VIRU|nr:hypothetical protein psal_cds_378 [Pandoravirus salinus]AGO84055.1 hypothetical protein psal_cds_378 [Pandoravirus salinus]